MSINVFIRLMVMGGISKYYTASEKCQVHHATKYTYYSYII